MSCITTFTGKHIDPVTPDPEALDIRDIAHALSLTCRGNGHVKHFYSVGQHCISCAREALARGFSNRTALVCLLHDASEAYMSDVPRPFKAYLETYIALEEKLLSVIYQKFLGSVPSAEELAVMKRIDDDMLAYDLALLFDGLEKGPLPESKAEHNRDVEPFESVEAEYLRLYRTLSAQV